MEILLIIAGMAGVTYLTRVSFLVLVGSVQLPRFLSRGLKFIPVAILTAFVVPDLLAPEGSIDLTWANHYLPAGVISALVAARWKNVFLAMGSGMLVMAALNMLARS